MNEPSIRRQDLALLADHLHRRRDALLRAWHSTVETDPGITTVAALARGQFIDHIPRILDAFESQLRAHGRERGAAIAEVRAGAAEHGADRWLNGYHYRETMREWGHLQMCLGREIEQFCLSKPELDAGAMSFGRLLFMQLFVECTVESAAGHVRLEQAEAASRLRDLEQVLKDVRSLEQERSELWHEATHDLRGNVSAVQLAATALVRGTGPGRRARGAKTVERTAKALTALLDDLVALARLEAGREHRQIRSFDAGVAIREVCRTFESLADERGLSLEFTAPTGLVVEGDPVKVSRIAQNLLINALKYTERGGVRVSLSPRMMGSVPSWELCIEDTGVGVADRASPAIARLLRTATRETSALDPPTPEGDRNVMPLPSASSHVSATARGEGVGLTIVKRLCELLDAAINLDTAPGRGTTVRIIFPCHYAQGVDSQPG